MSPRDGASAEILIHESGDGASRPTPEDRDRMIAYHHGISKAEKALASLLNDCAEEPPGPSGIMAQTHKRT
jgi:hypothetical protein